MTQQGRLDAVVRIVSREQWPRALLRAELIERGYDARGFLSVEDALADSLRDRGARPRALVLDLSDLEFTPLQVSSLAAADIPMIILGGGAELASQSLEAFPGACILKRPFMISDIVALIDRIVHRSGPCPESTP